MACPADLSPANVPRMTEVTPEGPARRTVATYTDYAEAQRAVDFLSDEDFPVEKVAIVGRGLRTEEQVLGRVTTGRAALQGALQGATLGLLFGLLFGLFFDTAPAVLGVLLYGLIVGAVLGAVLGALSHAALGGRRDFAAVSGMRADHYDIVVAESEAAQAESLLAGLPAVAARR